MSLTREFFALDTDPGCCVIQIEVGQYVRQSRNFVEVTVLSSSHCDFCWKCRLRTTWRALRWGRVDGDLCFDTRDDADRFLTRLHAAVDRVWPPFPPSGGPTV